MSEEVGQENIVPEGQGTQESGQPESTAQPSINPAWNDILGVVPSQFHSQITPHFQKWDQNYQNSIQKVHSQYEPWKPFIDNGVTPDEVNFGLNILQSLSNNPQEVINALNEWYTQEYGEEEEEQGQNESTSQLQDGEFDITQHPAFQQQEEAVRAMAEILLEQRRQEQEAAEDAKLESELNSLREKYKDRGDFDEDYVLGVALNDPEGNLEKAVEKFFEIQDRMVQNQRRPGPPVLGSGGAIPSQGVNVKGLDDKGRRALVAQMLSQAQQQT